MLFIVYKMKAHFRMKIHCILTLLVFSVICLLCITFWTTSFISSTTVFPFPSLTGHIFTNTSISDHNSLQLISAEEYDKAGRDISERTALVKTVCKQFHLGKYKWSNNSNDMHIKEPPTPLYSYFFWNRYF